MRALGPPGRRPQGRHYCTPRAAVLFSPSNMPPVRHGRIVTESLGALLLACGLAFAQTTVSPARSAASPVTGLGNFSHIVASMDRSVEFYRDGLGLELSQPLRPFDANKVIMR